MTNIIQEIMSIFKNEKEHNLKFIIEPYEFNVYMMYDPEGNFDEDTIIPITYDIVYEHCYINDKKYRKLFNCDGIEHKEIDLIKQVMDCIMKHKDEVDNMCLNFYCKNREKNVDNALESVKCNSSECNL